MLAFLLLLACIERLDATVISSEQDAYPLGTEVRILEDPEHRYDIDTIVSGALDHRFERSTSATPNFGLTESRYWIEVPLSGAPDLLPNHRLWYLEIGSPLIGSIILYDPRDGSYTAAEIGRNTPYLQRPLPSRHFVFPISLQPYEEKRLLIRLESDAPVQLPLRLVSPKHYLASNDIRQFGWGLYFGALLIMLLYNGCVFVALRERVYLHYVLNIGSLALTHAAVEGYASTYLWPADSWWNQVSVPVLISLTIFFAGQFVRTFLDTANHAPDGCDRILRAIQGIALVSAIGGFLLPAEASLQFAMALALLAAPTALLVGLLVLYRGNPNARLFVFASLALLLGATCFWLVLFGALPANPITLNALQYGVVAEAALLSIALASRINTARQAQIQADQQRQATEAAAEARSRFLTNMTHEMRTPITAIQGYTELALAAEPQGRQAELLSVVKTASQDLLTIVNQMLDMSRLNAGMLPLEPSDFDLDDLLEEVGSLFMAELGVKGVEMALMRNPNVPSRIFADRFRLKQILVNLLTNAVKFTSEGEIEVEIDLTNRTAAGLTLLFSVRDTGIGIQQASAERLFEPFTQVNESSGRRYSGSGLGLAICKRLIERMNGAVWVRSKPGEGAHFLFTVTVGHALRATEPVLSGLGSLRVAVLSRKALFRRFVGVALQEACPALRMADTLEELEEAQPLRDWVVLVDGDEVGYTQLTQLAGRVGRLVVAVTEVGECAAHLLLPHDKAYTKYYKPLCRRAVLRALQHSQALAARSSPRPSLLPPTANENRCRRVLVAEDSAVNRKLVRLLLTNVGIEADFAENGETALAMLGKGSYDCLLSDIRMPGMTGYELAARVRADARFDTLKLVALTANALPEEKARCLAAGFQAFLTKPIDSAELYKVLLGGEDPTPEHPAGLEQELTS